jgi:hypothetical protein
LEDPAVEVRIILKWSMEKWGERAWAGLILLRIGICGGLL